MKKNKKLIFLDTETTGLKNKDRLCQVAYKIEDKVVNEYFKPELPISVEAMSVSHITNKMVEDKPVFKNSDVYKELVQLSLDNDNILVAHNAVFDIGMLLREGIEFKNFICTKRIAQHLDEEAKIPRYNMQYLRYLLDLDIEATAHDALGDILVLEELFNRLFTSFSKKDGDRFDVKIIGEILSTDYDKFLDEMVEISSKPALIKKFPFGKHKGKFLSDVVEEDRGYLEWLYGQKSNEEILDEEWIHTLKHYLQLP